MDFPTLSPTLALSPRGIGFFALWVALQIPYEASMGTGLLRQINILATLFVMCASIQSFAITEDQKYLLGSIVGYVTKVGIDGATVWSQQEHIKGLSALRESLNSIESEDCNPKCLSDVNQFNTRSAASQVADGFGIFFSSLSLVGAIAGIPTAIFAPEYIWVPLSFMLGATFLDFVTMAAANGYLWDLKLHYAKDFSSEIMDDLKSVMTIGAIPFAATGIVSAAGLAATLLAFYLNSPTQSSLRT